MSAVASEKRLIMRSAGHRRHVAGFRRHCAYKRPWRWFFGRYERTFMLNSEVRDVAPDRFDQSKHELTDVDCGERQGSKESFRPRSQVRQQWKKKISSTYVYCGVILSSGDGSLTPCFNTMTPESIQ